MSLADLRQFWRYCQRLVGWLSRTAFTYLRAILIADGLTCAVMARGEQRDDSLIVGQIFGKNHGGRFMVPCSTSPEMRVDDIEHMAIGEVHNDA